ncbi:MAG: hypothetical protein U9N57_01930 [Pseudomonadota bacterium]|nr:hypothetical protein [Pseudomonadota bacterium]
MKLIKNLTIFSLFSLTLTLSACSIPDLPGPIGIPGIEIQPLSADLKQASLSDS